MEFTHLMTAWTNKEQETKQELTSSQIMSVLKVFKPSREDEEEEIPVEVLPPTAIEEEPILIEEIGKSNWIFYHIVEKYMILSKEVKLFR